MERRFRRRRHNRMKTGAFLKDGIARFRVWAPKAAQVKLRISAPGPSRVLEMDREDLGYWSVSCADALAGARYSFLLDGKERADPASHYQALGGEGASEGVEAGPFRWHDLGWGGVGPGRLVL